MDQSNLSDEHIDQLIIRNPDGTVTKVPLPTEPGAVLQIGRELDNEVTLVDPRTSRHHAKIRRVDDEQLEITDVGSANGTQVDATPLEVNEWQPFHPGQVAQLGDTRIMWEQSASSQATVGLVPISGPPVSPTPPATTSSGSTMLPWLIGGGLVVIALLFIGFLFFSQSRPQGANTETASQEGGAPPANLAQQTSQVASDEEAAGAAADEPTATPGPPTPTPAPADPRLYLEDVEFLPVISGALFDTQHVYMIVQARVENFGDVPFNVSTNQFRAITNQGRIIDEFGQQLAASEFSRLGVISRFEDLTLRSGGSVAEELVFYLEANDYDLTLEYLPPGLTPLSLELGPIAAGTELAVLLGTPAPPTAELVAAATEPTPTATATQTPTPTLTPTSTPTLAAEAAQSAEDTATPTATLTPTPTQTPTSTPEPEATVTPEDTATPAVVASDSGGRTIPRSSLVGTIAFPDFDGATYNLYFGDVASGDVSFWRAETSQPIFSHSGDRIAFHSWAEGSRGLVTSNLDQSGGFLVATFLEDQLPTWSPDDSEILFLSRRTGERQSQFYRVPSNVERPEAQLVMEGEYPTWHSDGTFVFKGWVSSGIGLRIAKGEITDYEPLTDNDSDTAPAISPDGSRIAFMSRRDDNWNIYVINSDGTNLRQLTVDDAEDGLPTWSPDGRAIAFVSNRGGPWAVWAMTPTGSGIRQLFTMQGSPDGFVASEPTHDTTRGWAEERISWKP